MATASGRAFARAALAGNPSDGYGGATLAVALANFAAKVEVAPDPRPAVDPPSPLVDATVRRFARDHGPPPGGGGVRVRWSTNIPREVGLGGSSAIVTATLRALAALVGLTFAPDVLADTALAVEVDDLGIAAGLQDRVAQAYGGLTFMEFAVAGRAGGASGRYESIDPELLPSLFVAYRPDAASASGAVHAELRARFDRGDPPVLAAMAELAALARGARDALVAGDEAAFGRCLDATFDVRRRIVRLNPRHLALIEHARRAGATANYTGSGGAIVGVWGARPDAVRAALRELGARCVAAAVA